MTEFITEEMRIAYEEAVKSIEEERNAPTHIRKARQEALLRWLKND